MKKLFLLLVVLMVSLGASAFGKTAYLSEEELKTEAERGFGEILDLWRDGKYDELYERTLTGAKQTKEGFIGRLAAAPCRPVCCWEKLQEVRVTVKSEDSVVIRAKVGLEENSGNTSTKTRDFKLAKEDGLWRISQADILSLSGAAKAKKKGPHAKRKKKVYYY